MHQPHRRAGALADLVLCLPRNRRRPRRRPTAREVDARRARHRAGLRFAFDLVAGALAVAWFGCFAAAGRRNPQRPPPR